jgi:hypothetical protein
MKNVFDGIKKWVIWNWGAIYLLGAMVLGSLCIGMTVRVAIAQDFMWTQLAASLALLLWSCIGLGVPLYPRLKKRYEARKYGPGFHRVGPEMQAEVKRIGAMANEDGDYYLPGFPDWPKIKIPFTPWMFIRLTPFLWNGHHYVRYYLEYTWFGGHWNFWKSRLACKFRGKHRFGHVFNFEMGSDKVCHHCHIRDPEFTYEKPKWSDD